MKLRLRLAVLLLFVWALQACGSGGDPSLDHAVLPPELFNWGGQPISVSLPAEDWRREKSQSGGLRGVRFVKSGSVGEEIQLAEHYSLDDRDRCARFTGLLRDLERLEQKDFLLAMQRTKLYASPPINQREARLAAAANSRLDQARKAYRQKQPVAARKAIVEAFELAARIQYSLDEVLDRVMFSADSYDSFGKVEVQDPVEGRLAGEPSVSVDFTLDSRDRQVLFHGRQLYVLKNNRLFVMTFFGLPENLPLFDKILTTVSFPPGSCEH